MYIPPRLVLFKNPQSNCKQFSPFSPVSDQGLSDCTFSEGWGYFLRIVYHGVKARQRAAINGCWELGGFDCLWLNFGQDEVFFFFFRVKYPPPRLTTDPQQLFFILWKKLPVCLRTTPGRTATLVFIRQGGGVFVFFVKDRLLRTGSDSYF